jgi:GrpB-like predicted nucleotidyltransferase (UPF0157 family)
VDRDALNVQRDLILIGGRERRPIRIEPYRPEWAERFEEERRRIAGALGAAAEAVEHIGSTAVPGLAAKPIVDILVAVRDPADPAVQAALEGAGYVLRVLEPGHRMFRTPELDVHVHVWPVDSPKVPRHLAFRDRLRASAADRRAYEQLKRELAQRDWDDMNQYADAKGPLIEAILRRATARP